MRDPLLKSTDQNSRQVALLAQELANIGPSDPFKTIESILRLHSLKSFKWIQTEEQVIEFEVHRNFKNTYKLPLHTVSPVHLEYDFCFPG